MLSYFRIRGRPRRFVVGTGASGTIILLGINGPGSLISIPNSKSARHETTVGLR